MPSLYTMIVFCMCHPTYTVWITNNYCENPVVSNGTALLESGKVWPLIVVWGHVGCRKVRVEVILAQQPTSSPGRLIVKVSRSHTHKHNSDGTPLNKWSARRRGRYLPNTQQTQDETSMSSKDSNPQSKQPSCCLTSHGHRDRQWQVMPAVS